jgi:mono/diheme cytochrome c family protein
MCGTAWADAPTATPEQEVFFETKVRPVFAAQCYSCHGPDAQMSNLRLDSLATMLKGGQRGPALVAGDPEKSHIVQAIRYTGDLKMPPTGKLSKGDVDAITAWVKMGAPWPAKAPANAAPPPVPGDTITPEQRKFWSFQPIRNPAPPKVKDEKWVKSPIDRFILAKLEGKGLHPAPPADKRTLIRRATLDLIGLPPTPAEVTAFLADKSPDAFAKVVDRLLASPHYGERWGRHWLDIARYADNKGYTFAEDRDYHYAYNYRDYVVRAFNEDMPYNQFILQQLAADQLPPTGDPRTPAAMGFLTLGRRFLNSTPDIIADRIDVTSRGLMALSVGCARCHNHKFDPIPTQDYYSMYAIFASSREPAPQPISPPDKVKVHDAYQAKLDAVQNERNGMVNGEMDRVEKEFRNRIGDYLMASHEFNRNGAGKTAEEWANAHGLNPLVLRKIHDYVGHDDNEFGIFGPWRDYEKLSDEQFTDGAKKVLDDWTVNRPPTRPLNPLVEEAMKKSPPASLKEVANLYDALFDRVDEHWRELAHTGRGGTLPDPNEEFLRGFLHGKSGPLRFDAGDLQPFFDPKVVARSKELDQQIEAIKKTAPPGLEYAYTLVDSKEPFNGYVFKRGNAGNHGEDAPRRFLRILAGDDPKPFTKGSGRLEMAEAIASPTNPLTSRVMVNRIWLHHFGYGIVRTPSDFGKRGEPPTHPELLDYLATQFIKNGWSVKKMHRMMMLSAAYQMSDDVTPQDKKIDPENRLLAHMNRQRLEFEPLRDSLLAVSGQLDPKIGGPAVEITKAPYSNRRSIYGYIDRQNLQGLFRTFDLASPDATTSLRFRTTVPQQALFMMNSSFVVDQAKHLAHRKEVTSKPDDASRIKALYWLALERSPTPEELKLGLDYLRAPVDNTVDASASPASAWHYGYGSYDGSKKRVTAFTPLPHFTGEAWQGGAALPDPTLGWLMLNKTGGHPGSDPAHSIIRRWVAPRDGVANVSGTIRHPETQGDGVDAVLVSSRSGELGLWTVHNGKASTDVVGIPVKRGDTLDFVVSCKVNNGFDSFSWSPTIQLEAPVIRAAAAKTATGPSAWSAEGDFSGPAEKSSPLTPWEKYAQVLLETNEFAFVD